MDVKGTARRQYADIVDGAARERAHRLERPAEGWLATFRRALGMSQADVAARLGVGRASVQQAERRETGAAITLDKMDRIASAMGGRLVYAIVPDGSPEGSVSDLIGGQAQARAMALIGYANAHMALEDQTLPESRNREKVDELAAELARTLPRGFWSKHDGI